MIVAALVFFGTLVILPAGISFAVEREGKQKAPKPTPVEVVPEPEPEPEPVPEAIGMMNMGTSASGTQEAESRDFASIMKNLRSQAQADFEAEMKALNE